MNGANRVSTAGSPRKDIPRVLIIDDDADFADNLSEALWGLGFRASLSADCDAAVTALAIFDPDVVLIDPRLERDEDAIEGLRHLQVLLPNLVVVVVTAFGGIEMAREVFTNGAYDWLQKPLNPPQLMATMERASERVALLRANREARLALERSTLQLRSMNRKLQMGVEMASQFAAFSSLDELVPYFLERLGSTLRARRGRLCLPTDLNMVRSWELSNGAANENGLPCRMRNICFSGAQILDESFQETYRHHAAGPAVGFPLGKGGQSEGGCVVLWNRVPRDFGERHLRLGELLVSSGRAAIESLKAAIIAREMEEKAREALRLEALGRLAGGIAHDFNNRLSAVGLLAELLRRKLPDDHPGLRQISAIVENVKQGESIVARLLAFGRQELSFCSEVDIDQSVRSLEGSIGPTLQPDVQLELDLKGSGTMIWIDPTQLDRIIMNLVLNASDAMRPDGGILRVRTYVTNEYPQPLGLSNGECVVVEVQDEGIGLTADVRARLFDPFFTTKSSGVGLGLAVVHGLVSEAHGCVRIDSVLGEGSSFRVYFPRYPTARHDVERPQPRRASVKATRTSVIGSRSS